jgi:DNA repair protein SbcC/Rad50
MKLCSLKLRNFRAWGECELDFARLPHVVVTGPNGAGKSSIIDGILWTIYGTTRSGGADSVVRLGEAEASGEVVFEAAGEVYTVVRQRSTLGRGKSRLDLYRGAAPASVSLSSKSIRETQQTIEDAVGVPVDVLTAASVLTQGDADRFTRAKPEERRDLLRQLLRLDVWRTRRDAARVKARDAEQAGQAARQRAQDIAPEGEAAQARERAAELLAGQERAKASSDAARDAARDAVEALDAVKAAAEKRDAAAHEVNVRAGALSRAADERDAAERLAVEADETAAAAAALPDLRETADRMRAEADRAADTAGKRTVARHALDAAMADWRTEHAKVKTGRRRTLHVAQRALKRAQVAERVLPDRRAAAAATAAALDDLGRLELAAEAARSALEGARRDYARTVKVAKLLRDVPCGRATAWREGPGAEPCDLQNECVLLADAREAAGSLEARRRDGATAAAAATATAAAVEARSRAELTRANARAIGRATRARDLAGGAISGHAQVDAARATLAGLKEIEARGAKARAELEALPDLEPAAAREQAERAWRAFTAAQTLAAKAAQAAQARDALPEFGRRVATCGDALTKAREALEGAVQAAAGVAAAAQAVEDTRREARVTAAATDGLHRQWMQAAAAQIAAEKAEQAAQAARETADKAAVDAARWRRVEAACQVAPVLVIERAIPRLEQVTNELLAEIAPRGMAVRIDTTRTTNAGDERETLEVVVTDDAGERPLDDYSGGERFRVDVSLRIALARLLAEREGVPVEWLVIDEGGFGALDDEGLDALTGALGALVRQYPAMLLITHIESVAEALPGRLVVERGPDGAARFGGVQ